MNYKRTIYTLSLFFLGSLLLLITNVNANEKEIEKKPAQSRHQLALKKLGSSLEAEKKGNPTSYLYFLPNFYWDKHKDPAKSEKHLQEIRSSLQHLKHVQNLEQITLYDGKVTTDKILRELTLCKDLESVTFSGSDFTSKGIGLLSKIPNLTDLSIEYPRSRLDFLRKKFKLRKKSKDGKITLYPLVYPKKRLSGKGVLTVLRKLDLDILDLHGIKIDHELIKEIMKQKHLTMLIIPGEELSKEDLELLAKHKKLLLILLRNHVAFDLETMKKIFSRFPIVKKDPLEGGYEILLKPLDELFPKKGK